MLTCSSSSTVEAVLNGYVKIPKFNLCLNCGIKIDFDRFYSLKYNFATSEKPFHILITFVFSNTCTNSTALTCKSLLISL